MSNSRKEKIIVTAINTVANQPGSFLNPEIPVGDKAISFDGHIDVMSDDSEKKESFLGKVPVQVKSRGVDEFSNREITFSFEMADYKNYYKTSGVLLIVGEVKEDGSNKLFYKSLNLLELDHLIRNHGTKNSRVIKLHALEDTSLHEVCVKFLEEQQHQPYELVLNKPFEVTEFQQFKFNSINNTENIFDEKFNLYGIKNQTHFPLAFAKINEMGFDGDIDYVIDSSTRCRLYTEITMQVSVITFTLEKSIQLILNKSKGTFTYKYLNFRSLSVQLKLIPFLKGLFLGKRIVFMEDQYFVIPQSLELVEDMESYEKLMSELLITFEILNINPEVNLEDEDYTISDFQGLINIVYHKEYEGINIDLEQGLAVYRIGKSHCVLFLKRRADSKEMTNAFSPDITIISGSIKDDPNTRFKHSPYILLNEEHLASALNLNINEIKRSFDFFNPFIDKTTFAVTNMFCLRCIDAFILSNNMELLNLALYIYDKTIGTEFEDDDVMLLNKYQIKKWSGDHLNESETQSLLRMKLRVMKDQNYLLLIGINILLEYHQEAFMLIETLTDNEQVLFKKLPIFKLLEKNSLLIE
ncbi:hypothetical protein Q0V21_30570 [Paenibacillus sp. 11B]|uniref:hypothetical protein n=1 Tax=Paenibacillus sp. 11B TaxID=3060965 RepID=UPI002654F0C0|nr:hypothetical protein [Paenibacillus sp. 11B]MDN8593075.1 hypothetical protein [Paenibacillus sp. 11B]